MACALLCLLAQLVPLAARGDDKPGHTGDKAPDSIVLPGQRVHGKRPVGKAAELDGGQAVDVVRGKDLRERHAELAEALAQLPGVQVLRMGGIGSPALLSVRGSSGDQVAIMLGDAVLDLADGAPLDLADVPLLGIERVEVYRGLAPLQVGTQPLGGTVRLTLRQGAGNGAQATAALGSYGTHQAEVGVGHSFGSWDGFAGLRLLESAGNFAYRSSGGTAFVGSDDRQQNRINNDLHRLGGVLSAQGHWSDRAHWSLRWLGSGLEQGAPGAAVFPALHTRFAQNRQVLVGTATFDDLDARGSQLLLTTHAVGRWSEVTDTLGELGFPWHASQQMTGGGAAAQLRLPVVNDEAATLTGLGRLSGVATQVQGLDLIANQQRPASQRRAAQGSLGALGRLGDWQATASTGGELAQQTVADSRQYASSYSQSRDNNRAAWHAALALRWQPQPQWLVDVAARRGLRLPNLQEMFGNSAAVIGNPALQNEQATSLELGTLGKTRAGPIGLTGEVRGHATWANNLIQLMGLGPHQAIYQNVGEARLVGGEASMSGDWRELRVDVRHTTLVSRDTSGRIGYDGKALPLRPRTRWGGTARWQATDGNWRPSLWFSLDWQAGSFVDAANLVVVPARTVAAAGVRVATSNPSVFIDLRVDNLANSAIYDLIGYPLAGRTVWLQLGWRGGGDAP